MFRWYLFCNILSFCWDFANNPLFIWDLQICVICIQKNQDFNKTKILSFYLGPSHLRTTKKQSIPPGSFQDNFWCQCFEGCNEFRCCTCHHQCEHVTPLPFWRRPPQLARVMIEEELPSNLPTCVKVTVSHSSVYQLFTILHPCLLIWCCILSCVISLRTSGLELKCWRK